jgi:hypothetical protein
MTHRSMDEGKIKELFKEALTEVLQERKDWFQDVFTEVIEDMALAKAIKEGAASEPVPKEQILKAL